MDIAGENGTLYGDELRNFCSSVNVLGRQNQGS
jgi:hypothetical protein